MATYGFDEKKNIVEINTTGGGGGNLGNVDLLGYNTTDGGTTVKKISDFEEIPYFNLYKELARTDLTEANIQNIIENRSKYYPMSYGSRKTVKEISSLPYSVVNDKYSIIFPIKGGDNMVKVGDNYEGDMLSGLQIDTGDMTQVMNMISVYGIMDYLYKSNPRLLILHYTVTNIQSISPDTLTANDINSDFSYLGEHVEVIAGTHNTQSYKSFWSPNGDIKIIDNKIIVPAATYELEQHKRTMAIVA